MTLYSFPRYGNWGSERLNNWPQITLTGRARILTKCIEFQRLPGGDVCGQVLGSAHALGEERNEWGKGNSMGGNEYRAGREARERPAFPLVCLLLSSSSWSGPPCISSTLPSCCLVLTLPKVPVGLTPCCGPCPGFSTPLPRFSPGPSLPVPSLPSCHLSASLLHSGLLGRAGLGWGRGRFSKGSEGSAAVWGSTAAGEEGLGGRGGDDRTAAHELRADPPFPCSLSSLNTATPASA